MYKRQVQRLLWLCLESWKLDYPTFFYKCTLRACVEVPAGIPLTKDQSSPLVGKVVLFDRVHSFGRDPHVSVRKEGDTHLASQICRINPGNQWGDNQVLQPVHPPIHYQILKSAPKFDLNPGQVSQIWLFGASSHTPKVCGFNSWLGHIPRLQVRLPVGVHTGGN